MPIGKNAIKRITNNGYSSVKSSAPDMENSEVAEEKAEVVEKKAPTAKKSTAKRTTPAVAPKAEAEKQTPKAKSTSGATKTSATGTKKPSTKKSPSTPKKSMETEPELSPVRTAKRVIKKATDEPKPQDNGCINIGRGELPVHLL